MRINSLYLKNFRNFEEATFHFPEQFTVLIGQNARGKSSILHGLRVAAASYFSGIPNDQVKSRNIHPSEVRLDIANTFESGVKPVVVSAEGTFWGIDSPIHWQRQIPEGSSTTSSSEAEVGKIRSIGLAKFNKMNKEKTDHLDLPVIAFFGTSRVHGDARKTYSRKFGRQIFKEGYDKWFEMQSSAYRHRAWLAEYDAWLRNGHEYPETKDKFFETLYKANPYLRYVDFYSNRLFLQLDLEDYQTQFLAMEYHSDGIQAYMKMVAELAYRCIVLNGYKREKAIEETHGIVMIDELDLHLHPKWQKHVVADLCRAFPNIQFVATTHSPIIVQSLKAEQVINLDRPNLPLDEDPNQMALSQVATEVMGLDGTRSEDFAKRYEQAKYMLAAAEKENGEILVNDYQKARDLLDGLEIESTNDPVYKAYLELKSENK